MGRRYQGPLQQGKRSAYVRGTRKNYTRKPTRSLTSQMKKVTLSQCETKIASQYEESIDLFHNQTLYLTNLLGTTQAVSANPGTTIQSNRIGNEVVARGIKLRFQFITSPRRPNFNCKIIVFRYEANQNPQDSNFWVGPAGLGANQARMLDFPDTRNVKVLKDCMIQNRNTLPVDETYQTVHNSYKDLWIPMRNTKIKYESNNGSIPKYTDIGVAIVCYDANNTLQTDLLAYVGYTSRFYFKDP